MGGARVGGELTHPIEPLAVKLRIPFRCQGGSVVATAAASAAASAASAAAAAAAAVATDFAALCRAAPQ